MDILAVVLLFGFVAQFMIRSWKAQGRLSARYRWTSIGSLAIASTTLALAPLLINWVVVPTAVWLGAVALLSGGVVGMVLRWPDLAWFTSRHPVRHALGIGITLLCCLLLTGLVVI